MTTDELKRWAIDRATHIVECEGVQLAISARELNHEVLEAESPLLATAIARGMGSLACAHPFLNGNGRTIMTVHTELANRAEIRVEWEKTRS